MLCDDSRADTEGDCALDRDTAGDFVAFRTVAEPVGLYVPEIVVDGDVLAVEDSDTRMGILTSQVCTPTARSLFVEGVRQRSPVPSLLLHVIILPERASVAAVSTPIAG